MSFPPTTFADSGTVLRIGLTRMKPVGNGWAGCSRGTDRRSRGECLMVMAFLFQMQ